MDARSYIGRELDGRFRIDAPLAAGGMGAVFRGTQLSVNREVAIKVIAPHVLVDDEAIKRLMIEAESLSGIRHPNVVSLVDFGQDNGTTYLVMELVEGESLRKMLGPDIGRSFVIEVLIQLAGALSEVHEAGVVHRDLKPDNLMVSRLANGRMLVTLVDFGIVRTTNIEELTEAGQALGTPAYMSPEQARAGDVGPASDIFSMGVIAYELITGRPPWGGDTALEILLNICNEPMPRIHRSGWPESLFVLVGEMLAKKVEDRPASAQKVLQRLERIAGEMQAAKPSGSNLMSLQSTGGTKAVDDSLEATTVRVVSPLDEASERTVAAELIPVEESPSRAGLFVAVAALALVALVAVGAVMASDADDVAEPLAAPTPTLVVESIEEADMLAFEEPREDAGAKVAAAQEREEEPEPAVTKPAKSKPPRAKARPKKTEAEPPKPTPEPKFGLDVTPDKL